MDVVPAATISHRCGYRPRPDSIHGPSLRFPARICPLRRRRRPAPGPLRVACVGDLPVLRLVRDCPGVTWRHLTLNISPFYRCPSLPSRNVSQSHQCGHPERTPARPLVDPGLRPRRGSGASPPSPGGSEPQPAPWGSGGSYPRVNIAAIAEADPRSASMQGRLVGTPGFEPGLSGPPDQRLNQAGPRPVARSDFQLPNRTPRS